MDTYGDLPIKVTRAQIANLRAQLGAQSGVDLGSGLPQGLVVFEVFDGCWI